MDGNAGVLEENSGVIEENAGVMEGNAGLMDRNAGVMYRNAGYNWLQDHTLAEFVQNFLSAHLGACRIAW